MNNKKNPFDKSLRPLLMTINAASVGVQLIKRAMDDLNLTQTEVEVLITVASYRYRATMDDIYEDRPYLSRDTIKRALLVLHEHNHVVRTQVIDHEDFVYVSTGSVNAVLKGYHRDSFENVSPSSYSEAIVTPAPAKDIVPLEPYPVDPVFDVLEALVDQFPDIAGGFARATGGIDWTYITDVVRKTKVVNTDPHDPMIVTPELDAAIGFCYGLVAPATDANEILINNPGSAARAHRAFYNRRAHDESYHEMMVRIHPAGIPNPGPVAKPKLGFFETMITAAKEWFASN